MNKFLLALVCVFFKFAFVGFLSLPWPPFDPLLALVVIYTFFHSFEMRDYLVYAFFCGFWSDIFSLNPFGIYMLSYVGCSFCVAIAARIIYRHNWFFVFPTVFLASFLTLSAIFLFKALFSNGAPMIFWGRVFLKNLFESIGTTLIAYPLYTFSKKCASELTG